MDTQFSDLRSLMNKATLTHVDYEQLWSLIVKASGDDRPEYDAQWIPYMEGFPQHWQKAHINVSSFEMLQRAISLLPFALFVYTVADPDEVMPYSWLDTAGDIFADVAMNRVGELVWRRRCFLTYHEDVIESSQFTNLRTLRLIQQDVYGDILQEMAQSPWAATVEHLDLALNHFSTDDLDAMFADGYGFTALKHLDMAQTGLGEDEIEVLANTKHLSTLESLDLCDNIFEEEGAIHLARSPYLKLKKLNLEEAQINEEGMTALAQSQNCAALTDLNLSWNTIGDEGASALASSPFMTNLKHLNLICNDISESGMLKIVSTPWIGNLIELQIGSNGIDDAVAKVIAQTRWAESIQLDFDTDDLTNEGLNALIEADHLDETYKKWFRKQLKA